MNRPVPSPGDDGSLAWFLLGDSTFQHAWNNSRKVSLLNNNSKAKNR